MFKPSGYKNQKKVSNTCRNMTKKISGKTKIQGSGIRRDGNLVTGFQKKWQVKKFSRFFFLSAVMFCIICLFSWASYKFLLSSDIFGVYTISIQGNENISEKKIIALSGIEIGSSLLLHDPEIIKNRLTKHDWIENAEVSRHFPSTIAIKIWTNKPLALINLAQNQESRLHYVDSNGAVFSPASGYEDIDFPVISGAVSPATLQEMVIADDTPERHALLFLRLAAKGNAVLPIQAISEIHIDQEKGIIVYLAENPFPIYIGQSEVKESYYRLVKILRQLYQRNKITEIAKIQLDYTENKVLVTMVQP